MNIFAISDLHLSLAAPFNEAAPDLTPLYKPMNVFGARWDDALSALTNNWRRQVTEQDSVLIPGDISWAMTMEEARYDFAFLASLPGRKIISRGNHDYWWNGISKLREALPSGIYPLQHDAISVGDYAVCATRGWTLPGRNDFKENPDRKIYNRELLRLEFALEDAVKLSQPIIVMLHYPPVYSPQTGSGFLELLKKYPVRHCIYGHLHGNKTAAFEGELDGITFTNMSMDRIAFCPKLIAAGN